MVCGLCNKHLFPLQLELISSKGIDPSRDDKQLPRAQILTPMACTSLAPCNQEVQSVLLIYSAGATTRYRQTLNS